MSLFNWRHRNKGLLGIEVRPAGIGLAFAGSDSSLSLLDFIEVQPENRSEVLHKWVREHQLEGMACNVVLHPDYYSSQLIERPAVEQTELADALRWKVKDMLEFSVDEAVIDTYEFPEDALRGKPAMINVVIARKPLILEIIDLTRRSGLKLKSIDVTELALRNLLEPLAEKGLTTALVMMRETSGMMLLVKDGMVYFSRRLHADMQALADPELKDRIGQQLALEVQRSMDYFESQMGQKAPRAFFVSSAINESELFVHLSDILGVDIAAIPENSLGVGEDQIAGSNYFIACGAAMRKQSGFPLVAT